MSGLGMPVGVDRHRESITQRRGERRDGLLEAHMSAMAETDNSRPLPNPLRDAATCISIFIAGFFSN
jgi:hypothetical protein